ncbi:MAG TPA: metallophosphoesterase [Herpetosiphonaceae bacterium]|nr:metallophosphoesterase [Herpetosiphonaceae bacterium]
MKLAAVGDLHCRVEQSGYWAPRLRAVNDEADVLLLTGDLTLNGGLDQLDVLLGELRVVTVPVVTVLGNHDYASGRARVFGERLRRAGIRNLEGAATTVGDVTFVGAMGAEGGFTDSPEKRRWSYAEQQVMARLTHYLQAADGGPRVVVLHYAPILQTLEGEARRLLPVLGSTALEVAIDTAGADLVLHGHAHFGTHAGMTRGGVPVYNVALPVLQRAGYATPYRIFEV